MKTKVLILFLSAYTTLLFGVKTYSPQEVIDLYLSDALLSNETDNLEDIVENLHSLSDNPINLNNCNRNNLESIPFLTDIQINNLLEYINNYGYLNSVYELSLIEDFDSTSIALILPFISVDDVKNDNIKSGKYFFKNIKNNFIIKTNYNLPSNLYGYAKYSFSSNCLSFSAICKKHSNKTFDYKSFNSYSAQLSIKDIGACKLFLIGDYKANFGQGLVFKNSMSFYSLTDITSLTLRNDGIKPYTGTAEKGFLRGVAGSFSFKGFNLNVFSSHTMFNGNDIILGSNFGYSSLKFKLSGNFMYNFLKHNYCTSVDYRLHISKFYFSGELAMDNNYKIATINNISFKASKKVFFNLLFRFYDKEFYSQEGKSYSASSKIQDETGIFLGVGVNPVNSVKFNFAADVFDFSSPKYNINLPSNGFKILNTFVYSTNSNSITINYNIEKKAINSNIINNIKSIDYYSKHNIKLKYNSSFKYFNSQTGFVANIYKFCNSVKYGYVIYQDFGYKNNLLNINYRLALFDINNYESRIYLYENDVYNSFSSPLYYGKGIKSYLNFKVNITKNLFFNFKSSLTYYTYNKTSDNKYKVDFVGLLKYTF